MFKGLKSKLEDEAKKLAQNVTQYGETIANQVRSSASDAGGSDVGNYAKRLFTPSTANSPRQSEKNTHMDGLVLENSQVSLDDDAQISHSNSAIMQGFDEDDIVGSNDSRIRRLSGASIESTESVFFNLPTSSSVSQKLETISSDVESVAESTIEPSTFEAVSKDQLSTVFNKLQGRAINYKNKYRDLVKTYNEVVRENEKCRTVLAQTQDKALQRIEKLRTEKRTLIDRMNKMDEDHHKQIEKLKKDDNEAKVKKLQELLEKCKENITSNKEKITHLTTENSELKKKLEDNHTDQGINDLAVERVTSEWKGRVDRLEEEWAQRMTDIESKSAIAIATSKAEMHQALQQKDQEIEKWINKCHALEKKDSDSNGKWQEKLDELSKTIYALECEKADMVEKLSKAKQEGVKLVKEEEEKRRKELEETNSKLEEEAKSLAKSVEEAKAELKKKDEEFHKKITEYKEQMQLAIEEREMQKAAAVSKQDQKNDEISALVEQLTTEKLQLQAQIEEVKDKSKRKIHDLSSSIEKNAERHKQELDSLVKEHEELLESIRLDLKKENNELSKRFEHSENELTILRQEHENLRKKYIEMTEDLENEEKSAESLKRLREDELGRLQTTINELNITNAQLKNRLKDMEEQAKDYKSHLEKFNEQHDFLKEENAKLKKQLETEQRNYSKELDELKNSLETTTKCLKHQEAEKEELIAEMQKMQDLAIINDQLKQQLEQTLIEKHDEKIFSEDLINVKEEISKTERIPVDILTNDLNLTNEENVNLHETVEKLKSEVEESRNLYEEKIKILSEQFNESRSFISSLQEQLDQSNKTELDLQQQLEKTQTDLDSTSKQIQLSIEEKEKLILENNSKGTELISTIQNLKEKLESTRLDADQLEIKLIEKESDNKSLQNQILELEERIQQNLNQTEQLSEQRSLFENQYNTLKNSYSVLEEKLAAIEAQNIGQIKNLTDQLSSQAAQIEQYESQMKEIQAEKSSLLNEAENIKIERMSLQQKLDDSTETSQQHLESLQRNEKTNEKMRLAFLEKEKVVSDLQKKIEQAVAENRILCEEVSKLNNELALIKEKSAHQRTSLDAEQHRQSTLQEKLEKQKKEIYDLNETLVVERGKKAEIEAEILKQKHLVGEKQKELDSKNLEIQQLNDQMHSINSMSTTKDIELENMKRNEAGLQQKLIQFQEIEQALDHSRQENMELSQKIAHLEIQESSLIKQVEELALKLNSSNNEIEQMNIAKVQIEEKEKIIHELQEAKLTLDTNVNELSAKVLELTNKLEEVEKERLVEIKRTQAKAEADRQKTVKNLQNEVRQLYQDFTRTAAELETAKETIKKFESQIDGQYEDKKRTGRTSSSVDDTLQEAVDQEELVSLRERVYQYQSEILELRDRLSRELNSQGNPDGRISPRNGFGGALDVRNMTRHTNVGSSSSSYCENLTFAEPTEAEYLRNVLYRYMSERETLGKEIVTLAKVIATVVKFTPKQLDEVVHKEQERHQRWFEDAAKLKQYSAPVCVANKRRLEYDRM